jgi:hypothetical protein
LRFLGHDMGLLNGRTAGVNCSDAQQLGRPRTAKVSAGRKASSAIWQFWQRYLATPIKRTKGEPLPQLALLALFYFFQTAVDTRPAAAASIPASTDGPPPKT